MILHWSIPIQNRGGIIAWLSTPYLHPRDRALQVDYIPGRYFGEWSNSTGRARFGVVYLIGGQ